MVKPDVYEYKDKVFYGNLKMPGRTFYFPRHGMGL